MKGPQLFHSSSKPFSKEAAASAEKTCLGYLGFLL
jgi:hypothetical protein